MPFKKELVCKLRSIRKNTIPGFLSYSYRQPKLARYGIVVLNYVLRCFKMLCQQYLTEKNTITNTGIVNKIISRARVTKSEIAIFLYNAPSSGCFKKSFLGLRYDDRSVRKKNGYRKLSLYCKPH